MAALRAAVFPLSAKNRRGGHFPTPSSARVIAFKFGVWLGIHYIRALHITQVKGGVHLHVRTCTAVFHVSQTAGRIAFKLGV